MEFYRCHLKDCFKDSVPKEGTEWSINTKNVFENLQLLEPIFSKKIHMFWQRGNQLIFYMLILS